MTLSDDRRAAWHDLADALGAKYAPHVLFALASDERRFSDLRRELDVTATTLSRRLRALSCRGLVTRRVEATSPPTVWYALTDAGHEVVAALSSIDDRARLVSCGDDACGDDACAHLSPPCCE
ncbi:winged helix-turn-helix transcriptional regulator [Salinigranum sp. GCM10025319]|uniref:winged helix-turn-helix transcriptional regulator n=1 Tax=Salinigranum sp. GCM10025319 TaxID=3252687 RepID=UPI0036212169